MAWWDRLREAEVEPSLYAADFAKLGEQIEELLAAGARVFHYDVGDGHFVEPIIIGPIVLRSIGGLIHDGGGRVDVHLMVESPEGHFRAFREAGADSVTFHYEAVEDLGAVTASAREHGLGVGVALKPGTAVEEVAEAAIAAGVDLVLCMSIEPGYSGQRFMPEAFARLRRLRELLPESIQLQVDGGVNRDNIREAREAGANLLVAATAVFGQGEPAVAYGGLVDAVE
ncbi:MAG: ribulose-phosphate 3-epimerase [Actinobacteria bacterium]|nr:MAG: ribulose-phosphate 3-epimerase [Actinomycetota bacterium]